MKGWQIFSHSARLVFNNLDSALRVSLLLYLVQIAGQIVTFLNPPEMVEGPEGMMMPEMAAGYALQSLLFGILGVIASLWIAVAWHRFVLAEEYPRGWIPRWHGANMLSYLGRSILLGLLILLAIFAISLPSGLILAPMGAGVLIAPLVIGVAAGLFFRLCPILPAAAMGRKMRLSEAWTATKGETGTMLVLALIVVGGSILAMLPTLFNQEPGSVINLVYSVVVNWFLTMIGISVLTTIYGHYIEGREIG